MSFSLAAAASSLPAQLRPLATHITLNPLATGLTSLLALYCLKQTISDYRAWLAIGLGGTSHNPLGYTAARLYGLLGSDDLKSTHVYESGASSTQYLSTSDVPIRRGQAPPVSGWAFPVRQLSGRSTVELRRGLDEMLSRVVASKTGTDSIEVSKAASQIEGGYSSALFVEPRGNNGKKEAMIESYHIHSFEGSAHVRLSPADAKVLLDRGWGERHPLSGRMPGKWWRKSLPLGFVMLYAPRDEDEIKVHEAAAKAAMAFAVENLS